MGLFSISMEVSAFYPQTPRSDCTGLEVDGREITPLDPQQIKQTVKDIQDAGVEMVALIGVFSPLDHSAKHEETCKKQMLDLDPSLSIVCSNSIGGVGLLERENATILNASILTLAKRTVRAFCNSMAKLSLDCTLYLTQNDGTLTDAATASELPIKTFASGPTNSVTGAAFLASLDKGGSRRSDTQVIVIDVGGTTSDACALLPSGFPRQAPNFVEVGGVRTAFSMPDVLSIGLGGGSRVVVDEKTGRVNVGPESVGHYLTSKAMVFGGDVMTATDIVVASGAAEIGDLSKAKGIPSDTVGKARSRIKKILERSVDDMKISEAPVTLLLVGGGSVVLLDQLEGVQECIMPPHHDSANAVGAAIAKVAGEVDVIEILAERDEKTVIEAAKRKTIEAAVARGADRNDVKIVEIDKLPLQYVTNKATRFVIKAVGRLAPPDPNFPRSTAQNQNGISNGADSQVDEDESDSRPRESHHEPLKPSVKHSAFIDINTYKPTVTNGIWYLSPVDLEFIATGTGVLGTGGGGPSRLQYFHSLEYLNHPKYKGKMRVISPQKMKDSDVCVFGSWYGAPSVSGERIPAGTEIMTAIDYSTKMSGHGHFEAVMADEIGGGNGLAAFPSSVYYDIPVIDGDMMGRAYPTLEHGLLILHLSVEGYINGTNRHRICLRPLSPPMRLRRWKRQRIRRSGINPPNQSTQP